MRVNKKKKKGKNIDPKESQLFDPIRFFNGYIRNSN